MLFGAVGFVTSAPAGLSQAKYLAETTAGIL
jgi:hypothetical protein